MLLKRTLGAVLFACASLASFGVVLPPGNWHEPVRAALQQAIDRLSAEKQQEQMSFGDLPEADSGEG